MQYYSAEYWWLRDCPSHDEVYHWHGVSNMSSITFCIDMNDVYSYYDYAACYIYDSSLVKSYGGKMVV